MEAGLDHLLREFAALTEEPVATEGVPAAAAAPGATDSFLIASRTYSRPAIVAIADFVTDGSADQVEINAAFTAALPSAVGSSSNATVVLAAGRYTVSGAITIPGRSTLTGTGQGSNIEADTAGIQITLDSAGAEVANMMFISN